MMLANYMMKIYASLWFQIKRQPSVKYGPVHMFRIVHLTRQLPKNVLKIIIDPVTQRNAFFCYPENMLTAMAVDEKAHSRELAFQRVLKARKEV